MRIEWRLATAVVKRRPLTFDAAATRSSQPLFTPSARDEDEVREHGQVSQGGEEDTLQGQAVWEHGVWSVLA